MYERLDGDGRWLVNIQVNGRRLHQVVGLESEGFTKTQAQDLIDSVRAQKHTRRHGVASSKRSAVSVTIAAKEYLEFLRETGGKDIVKKQERLRLHVERLLGNHTLGSLTETDSATLHDETESGRRERCNGES